MPIDVAARVIANRPLSSEYNILALAAPAIAAAAIALSQVSTSTLIHAGENTSRARSWRRTTRT